MQVPPGAEGIRFARPTQAQGAKAIPQIKKLPQEGGLVKELYRKNKEGLWSPSFSVAFRLLILIRVCGAMYSSVTADCDEVYNYWEPLHFLLHRDAFRTWEYSSKYAIRSWAYILLHTLPSRLVAHINPSDKRIQFFATRISLAAISSLCEARLYRSVSQFISPRIGRYTLVFLLLSAGMYNASVAFLPSSFSMYFIMLGYSFAIEPVNSSNERTRRAVLCFAVAAVVGWPFSALLSVPFVLEELLLKGQDSSLKPAKRIGRLVRSAHLGLAILAIVVAIDSYFYGRLALVPWNIIRYNALPASSEGAGPELYGVEPWYFYMLNGALNFNIVLPLALLSLPILLVTSTYEPRRLGPNQVAQANSFRLLAVRLSPVYIWLGVLSLQPHKEERFLFPAFPLICLNAAIALGLFRGLMENFHMTTTKAPFQTARTSIFKNITGSVLVISTFISVARIFALQHYFRSPMPLLHHLQYYELPKVAIHNYPASFPSKINLQNFHEAEERLDISVLSRENLTLCYGKEWYRFPSTFLVPNQVRVEFIDSDFDGQLPKHFVERRGETVASLKDLTSASPDGFNDLNQEELDRYVPVESCSYLIDLDYPQRYIEADADSGSKEVRYSVDAESWDRVKCLPFLDLAHSSRLTRSFYFPFIKDSNTYGEYCLLRNKKSVKAPKEV